MRVLHLIKSLGRGGAEMLLPMGYEVADHARFEYEYAYFLPWKDSVVHDLEFLGANVSCLRRRSSPSILAGVPQLTRFVKSRQIDMIHAHLPLAGVVARLAGLAAGAPVVYSEHNLQERYNSATRLLSRWTWSQQDAVVAVSADVANSIRRNLGVDVPIYTVVNGVDVRRFDPVGSDGADVRLALGISGSSPVVGTVAVFRVQKRLDHWLAAAKLIRDARPESRFLLVGDGPERETVLREAATMGLSDVLLWVGLNKDVRPYLAAMDVFLMSSEFEGLPIALLEAMAMGVPPVATAVGGVPEVVQNGVSGLLVPFGSISELASAAVRLIDDVWARKDYGGRARDRVSEEFSISKMQRNLEEIYSKVAADRGIRSLMS